VSLLYIKSYNSSAAVNVLTRPEVKFDSQCTDGERIGAIEQYSLLRMHYFNIEETNYIRPSLDAPIYKLHVCNQ